MDTMEPQETNTLDEEDDEHNTSVHLVRSQESFDKINQFEVPPKISLAVRVASQVSPSSCSGCFFNIFPFFDWITKYNFKKDLMDDLVSGCTVGVMHIPQGLAYSMLAGVPPITGLYMAFFPVLLYILMGTSRHVSMGTFSVVCLMTKAIVSIHANPDTVDNFFVTPPSLSFSDAFVKPDAASLTSVQVAVVVCFAVGFWQVLMGLFQLGNISVLLSDTMVSGFSTAAAVHVMASQLGSLLGVTIGKYNADFKILLVLRDVVSNISSIHIISLAMSVTVMAVLISYTECIKPRTDKMCHFPVPVEMMCIIAGTAVSYMLDLGPKHNVKCVGSIPRGLPSPSLPAFWLLPEVLFHSLPIAVVGFTITLSMASILAKKGHYRVQANQELIACGSGNLFASFFSCVPFAASLSRSLIQQNVGGKTQIASVFSCTFILLILLIIGPFFEPLPNCVLAAIVVVSLKGMFMQVKEFPVILKKSKMDAIVWMGTFLVSVLWDIDYGLGAGFLLSVLSILLYGQKLHIYPLGKVPNNNLYLDLRHYQVAKEFSHVKILHVSGSLHFANKNHLDKKLSDILGLHALPPKIGVVLDDGEINPSTTSTNVVLDMSGVSFIDPSAADAMSNIRDEISKKLNGQLYLACCPPTLLEALKKYKFFSNSFPVNEHIFPSIHDAVLSSQQKNCL